MPRALKLSIPYRLYTYTEPPCDCHDTLNSSLFEHIRGISWKKNPTFQEYQRAFRVFFFTSAYRMPKVFFCGGCIKHRFRCVSITFVLGGHFFLHIRGDKYYMGTPPRWGGGGPSPVVEVSMIYMWRFFFSPTYMAVFAPYLVIIFFSTFYGLKIRKFLADRAEIFLGDVHEADFGEICDFWKFCSPYGP